MIDYEAHSVSTHKESTTIGTTSVNDTDRIVRFTFAVSCVSVLPCRVGFVFVLVPNELSRWRERGAVFSSFSETRRQMSLLTWLIRVETRWTEVTRYPIMGLSGGVNRTQDCACAFHRDILLRASQASFSICGQLSVHG